MAKRRRRRGGRRANLTLISAARLRAELDRRAEVLVAEERTLQARLDELRAEIAAVGGSGSNGKGSKRGRRRGRPPGTGKRSAAAGKGRRRPRNEMNLRDALRQALRGKTLGVKEAVEAVTKAGYRSSSANFNGIVNQALLNKKLFKKVARGQYTAA